LAIYIEGMKKWKKHKKYLKQWWLQKATQN
jgi:hypothetical protein